MITNQGLYELARCLLDDGTFHAPNYIAVGVGTYPEGEGPEQTKLANELCRIPISSHFVDVNASARLVAVFRPVEGAGPWNEIGIFYGPARELVLHSCDTIQGWTSDNTLSLDTSERRQGTAALHSYGPYSLSFRNASTIEWATTYTFTEDDYFKFWYYIGDTSKVSSITIELGSTTNDDEDEYQWTISPSSLTNGWNFLTLQISSATKIGSPDLAHLRRFRLVSTKSDSVHERIDWLRLFGDSGTMWARVQLDQTIQKTPFEARAVYYYFQMTRPTT